MKGVQTELNMVVEPISHGWGGGVDAMAGQGLHGAMAVVAWGSGCMGQWLHGAVDSGNCYRYHTIIHLAVVIMNIERNFHDQIIIMSGELVLEDL